MFIRMFLRVPLLLCPLLAAAQVPPVTTNAGLRSNAVPHAPATWPGQQPDGSVLLPNQWSLRPVGKQVALGDFPVNIAVHPSGKFAAVLHAGYGPHEIVVVKIPGGEVLSRTNLSETFYGLEFSQDGRQLFASGAGDEVIHAFTFGDGKLANHRAIRLRPARERGVPAGLAVDAGANQVFVANVWGHRVTRVSLGAEAKPLDIPLAAALIALGEAPVQPSTDFETAAADKRAEAALYHIDPADSFPYACRLDESRQRLYVSLWARAEVAVVDLRSLQVTARWPTEEHPCEMVLSRSGKFLFVANASRNTVTVFDTAAGKAIETIWAALYPQVPPGSTPNSLALSPDGAMLFIANADNNAVAVFDVATPGRSRSLGFIPVGWYPTSVRVTPDGKHLLVANGKGLTSKPNPRGPQPGVKPKVASTVEYIAKLFHGTLSVIELPKKAKQFNQFAEWTRQTYECSPLKSNAVVSVLPPVGNPVPGKLTDPSPIKYCIYIIKENRTYDQMLGDLPQGNGDPKLCLFPERVTPNHHALAREFVLLDNFYVNAEVSADGHEWSMGAYATDFVEKTWPLKYGHSANGKFPYPAEGNFAIAMPAGGYLWDRALEAGISYRSYGEFVQNGRALTDPARSRVKTLEGHFDPWFRSFDLAYPDTKRAERFIAELRRFETEGGLPRLQIVRLPNDHTHGATAGSRTPTSFVAENDLALGMVVEAVSQSRFWPETAIFVLEDDAQNGPDHVDAHRSIAYVISPWAKRRSVDSTPYSTSSMLRTMELILGLRPMSQFDAAATPMFNSFSNSPDLRPYRALPANVSLDERNKLTAWGGNLKLNFAKEDAADDLLLNEVIWRSVRGPNDPMPVPVRAGFVFTQKKPDADGD